MHSYGPWTLLFGICDSDEILNKIVAITKAAQRSAAADRRPVGGAIAKSSQTAQCWDGTTSPDTGAFVPLSQCWRATNPKMVGGEPAACAINQSREWTEDAPSACCSLKRP